MEKQNRNDFYKDELRTTEIKARQMLNKKELRDIEYLPNIPGGKKKSYRLCRNLLADQKKSWPKLAYAYRELANVRTQIIISAAIKSICN